MPLQDLDRLLDGRLLDQHRLEAPLQGRVPLDVLAVLVQRRRADRLQLAARQRRLEDVRGVHRALGRASADQRVQLVDEQDAVAEFLTSSMIFLRRSSNSPRYLVPATSEPMSSVSRRLPISVSGTSPEAMRWARPSTIAVLPTPGSPIRAGLFLVRRERIWMTRSISLRAADDRIELVGAGRGRQVHAELVDDRRLAGVARLLLRVALALVQDVDDLAADLVQARRRAISSTPAAMPSPSRTSPSSRCSVPM